MGRSLNRLTVESVQSFNHRGYYADGGNLFLQVAKNGSKSWIFKFERDGNRRELGLGPTHTISLADARVKAAELRKMLIEGKDPYAERQAEKLARKTIAAQVMSFDQCADAYIAAQRHGWKNEKHAAQWGSTLCMYASPIFGKHPVSAIDTDLILRILEPIWTEKHETASRLRGRIESVLDWACTREFRTGNNPARWKGHLENLLAKVSKSSTVAHHSALPYARIASFLDSLRQQAGTAARAVEFAILTACRSGEVRGASWREIDLDGALWTIPVGRMKAQREHVAPLSAPAIDLLLKLKAESSNDLVFPGVRGGQLSDMTLTAVIRRMNETAPVWTDTTGQIITVHGFRSTFRDWAGELSAFPREVIEHALAYQLRDKAEAAYQRGTLLEKRRLLMAAWADYCNRPATATATITPIRATA